MGVTDIFEFDRREGEVVYLKTRAGADPMFRDDRFVRVLDDPVYTGYAHTQSLCDVMANGKTEAKQWFRFKDSSILIAEVEKEIARDQGEPTPASSKGPGDTPLPSTSAVKEALRELQEAAEIAEVKLRLEKAEAERMRVRADVRQTEADLRLHEDAYRRKALVQLAELHETFDARDGVLKFTDKDRFFLKEKKLNILYGALDTRDDGCRLKKTLEISTVAAELGYRLNSDEACAVGKKMAKAFRDRFPGAEIPKEEKIVNGVVRLVNSYDDAPATRDLMERAVEEVASERGLHRVQIRRIA
eukprot:jgi/Mesvir1/10349/Mv10550-RA.1